MEMRLQYSPNINTLPGAIQNEQTRYKSKGYGLVFALFIAVSYFSVFPKIAHFFWRDLTEGVPNIESRLFYILVGLHVFSYATSNSIMIIIYKLKLPFFERYKVSNKPWPWEENREKWRATLWRALKLILGIKLIVVPFFLYIDTRPSMIAFRYDYETFPSVLEITVQVFFSMLCEDFVFYWGHRILHLKAIYPYIHKVHHEHNYPISLSAEFSHPVDYFLTSMLPNVVGLKILGTRMHLITYIIYLNLRTFETVDGHCGYEFSWSPFRLLPLSAGASYHNFHHSHNVGNFGSFFIFWDTMMETNKFYYKFISEGDSETKKKN